jgi:hypothetical protein
MRPSSSFALIGQCVFSGFLLAIALGGDCVGIALIFTAPTWGDVLASVGFAMIALFFTGIFGALLLKDIRNYQFAKMSVASNAKDAAHSLNGDQDDICLECGQPIPVKSNTCSACGWSYSWSEEVDDSSDH